MRFVDSHSHLGDMDAREALALGEATGMLIVSCGTDRRSSRASLKLAAGAPGRVVAFVGVHPSEKSGGLGWLPEALEAATGLGEVGLDPSYSPAGPRGAQRRTFVAQLELAQKLGKPVQVHSRGAEETVLEVLDGFRLRGVLMHWFESEERLPAALDRGYLVSYGPAVLYSRRLQRMAAKSNPDQVLTETDSPVAYGPLGGVKGPSLVPSVVFKLAELWGGGFEEARVRVAGNAGRFLRLPEKG